MTTIFVDRAEVSVPEWVRSLKSFRRWYHSDEFPESGRIGFVDSQVWVDISKEQLFSHNQVKAEYTRVLAGLAKTTCPGRYMPDGMLLTNIVVGFSWQPDGCFVNLESLQLGRVRLVPGVKEGFVELDGTPDMILEVLSASSEQKYTVTLRRLYWEAGIQEYWLVDARGDRLDFTILRHGPRGYVAVRKQAGWIKSEVFGKSFRLVRGTDDLGHPVYTLEVR
jgi:Uma2 family endonuclease